MKVQLLASKVEYPAEKLVLFHMKKNYLTSPKTFSSQKAFNFKS